MGPEEQLAIVVERDGDRALLRLRGEIDPHTAPLLDAQLDEVVASGAQWIGLDMSEVGFIDSSGLRVIIGARRAAQERGDHLVLRSPSPTARRLLEVTGLLDFFDEAEEADR